MKFINTQNLLIVLEAGKCNIKVEDGISQLCPHKVEVKGKLSGVPLIK
jgi:hypothetical protein